jgi:glycosyltransferase involved in cell wall biosynthesis
VRRFDRKRARHVWGILRQGPTEAGYAFFRARRRRRNLADAELELSESDALALSPRYDLDAGDLRANEVELRAYAQLDALEIGTVQWFLPWFHLVHGGGIHTVLRLADHFARRHGAVNRFRVYDRDEPGAAADVAGKIASAFPGLAGVEVTAAGSPLAPCNAAIATSWPSVYPLVRFRRADAKFFLVQDWEPDFHPAGSASALLEEAARLGLPGIVNTQGLADVYREYGNPAVAFRPAVDTERYHPPKVASREGPPEAVSREGPAAPPRDGPVRIFFYGRPSVPRNAFGLGLAVLRRVKAAYGEQVEIVCAGEDWSPGQYGMADVLSNEGMLEDPDAVADLYRTCHIGLVFMLTRHPSYQPLEFMASGMATVSNRNPWTGWLLRHDDNALLAPALPALVAEQVGRLVEDAALRERIAQAGLREARATTWDEEIERVWAAMTKRGQGFS